MVHGFSVTGPATRPHRRWPGQQRPAVPQGSGGGVGDRVRAVEAGHGRLRGRRGADQQCGPACPASAGLAPARGPHAQHSRGQPGRDQPRGRRRGRRRMPGRGQDETAPGVRGPGLPGFGALAWLGMAARMFRNPRRTRAGVSRTGVAGRSQGRRRSAASGRARQSWAQAAMISQVHRSAAPGSRILGAVQPRTCLKNLNVCSPRHTARRGCAGAPARPSASGSVMRQDYEVSGRPGIQVSNSALH